MRDNWDLIMINLNKFKRLNQRKMEQVMDKYDLRKIDMEIIFYLADCGDKDTAKDITAEGMFTKGHISQSVKRLSEKGYIKLTADKNDKRVQHMRLDDSVQEIFKEIEQIKKEIEDILSQGVTDEETEIINKVFSRVCENINENMEI